jgi:hypothetical protein
MKPILIKHDCLSIHPSKIFSYQVCEYIPYKMNLRSEEMRSMFRPEMKESFINSKRKSGENLSSLSKKKINKAIDYLLTVSNNKKFTSQFSGRQLNFKIAFITLTLQSKQVHHDNIIKQKCLNSFLIELRKFYKVKHYLWRSEYQENGNIHFHVLIDKFIPWNELRNRWNRIINKLGYVDNYRENMRKYYKEGFRISENLKDKRPVEAQLKSYRKNVETDWQSPNSTDIHSIHKIINIKAYLTKYLTKEKDIILTDDQKKEFEKLHGGRLWSCNYELSNLTGAKIEVCGNLNEELLNVIKNSGCRKYESSYFQVYYINASDLIKYGGRSLFQLFSQYLIEKFNYNIQLSTA